MHQHPVYGMELTAHTLHPHHIATVPRVRSQSLVDGRRVEVERRWVVHMVDHRVKHIVELTPHVAAITAMVAHRV